jgi:hypothetical protein
VALLSKSPVVTEIRETHHRHEICCIQHQDRARAGAGAEIIGGWSSASFVPQTWKINPLVGKLKIPILLLLVSCREICRK